MDVTDIGRLTHERSRVSKRTPEADRGGDRGAGHELAEGLARFARSLREVELSFEAEAATLWSTMVPRGRPCFTTGLIDDYLALYGWMRETFAAGTAQSAIKYLVYRSGVPGVFSLGGDLDLFARLIQERDREGLRRYAHACARMTYENSISAGDLPVVTVALIQGQALGGGFESALSCNVLIAEESAVFGLPEVLFNLFPGMGAYSYLARRIGGSATEKLILSGRTYTAGEMLDLGAIDAVVPEGAGEAAVRSFIESGSKRHNAQCGVYRTRRRVAPLALDELRDVTDIWVDCALNLEPADVRKMGKLVSAQDRLRGRTARTLAAN